MASVIGIPQQEASELRKAIEKLKRSMPEQLEVLTIVAKMDFAKYEAYIAAGFKPEQALDLIKAEKVKATV